MSRYKELMQRLAEQKVKEAEFNRKCEDAIACVEETVKRIDKLEEEIEKDTELLKQWRAAES